MIKIFIKREVAMEEKNTRELIMQEALNLFAAKGYAAVSMRDIATAVGIRASSIYNHFSGKQELFDALVQKANNIKNSLQVVFLNAFSKVEAVEEDAFVQTGAFFLTGYLQNPQIAPLLRVLECERFHNENADRAWQELMISAPIEHEINIFNMLKIRGIIEDENAKVLASEYQSAILLAYFTGDIDQLKQQLKRFYQRIFG